MISVCTEFEQQKKFHQSHQLSAHKKMLREIQIPPRKQLSTRFSAPPPFFHNGGATAANMFADYSFKSDQSSFRHKYLPSNNLNDDDGNPFTSDYFRMYEFKVRMCPQGGSHDWMNCPFAHPGEKALRRDPLKHNYTGAMCSEFRKSGNCRIGKSCKFAHGVFESWLHPTRYRTEACKDGRRCIRKVCFFAHTPRQIRIPPEESKSPAGCCGCCHHGHRENMGRLMMAMEAMNVSEFETCSARKKGKSPWMDALSFSEDDDDDDDDILALCSAPNLQSGKFVNNGDFEGKDFGGGRGLKEPDFKWINDLMD